MRSQLLKIPCLCMAVIPTPTIGSMTSFFSHWKSRRLNIELGNECEGAMSHPIAGAQTTELLWVRHLVTSTTDGRATYGWWHASSYLWSSYKGAYIQLRSTSCGYLLVMWQWQFGMTVSKACWYLHSWEDINFCLAMFVRFSLIGF